jgi:hypothetical protein
VTDIRWGGGKAKSYVIQNKVFLLVKINIIYIIGKKKSYLGGGGISIYINMILGNICQYPNSN